MTKDRTSISDPNHPEYWPEARDAIMNLCPFYDPHHKCGIVRENIFKDCLAELRERERVAKLNYFDGAKNLAYIVIFLRNGGERLRAIWLTTKTLGVEIKEASEWVDSVRLIDEPAPELLPETPPRNVEVVKTASHWPPTVTERMKSKKLNPKDQERTASPASDCSKI